VGGMTKRGDDGVVCSTKAGAEVVKVLIFYWSQCKEDNVVGRKSTLVIR